MKKGLIFLIGITCFLLVSSCKKKEQCLKCTTVVSGVETVQPETCDTEEAMLDAKEAEYKKLVTDFVNDGWEASINCVRQ